jgi:hypothetical protein
MDKYRMIAGKIARPVVNWDHFQENRWIRIARYCKHLCGLPTCMVVSTSTDGSVISALSILRCRYLDDGNIRVTEISRSTIENKCFCFSYEDTCEARCASAT